MKQEIRSVELGVLSVQCNFFIFDHVTFTQFKICTQICTQQQILKNEKVALDGLRVRQKVFLVIIIIIINYIYRAQDREEAANAL